MSAAIRTALVLLGAIPLVIWLGMELGNEEFVAPVAFCVLLIGFGVSQIFFTGLRYEAVVLSLLLAGYIIGNRGFAQLSPAASFPLFVGEIGMVACLALFAQRSTLQRTRFFPPHPLGRIVFLFLLLGAVRLLMDVRTYRVNAIRDSAMIYYALFFFIAYQIGTHSKSRAFVEKWLLLAFFLMIPANLAQNFAPDLIERIAIRGTPLIYQKGDLVGIFFGVGMVFFYLGSHRSRWSRLLLLLALLSSVLVLQTGSRAGYVAAATGLALLALARRGGLVAYQVVVLTVVLLSAALYTSISKESSEDGRLRFVYEKAVSIVDWSGTGTYVTAAGVSPGNNQFRIVWWQSVWAETIEQNPWFGLGFGYDLAEQFLRNYYGPIQGEDFTARSPHSYLVTTFGRLGVFGVSFVLLIGFYLVRGASASARACAHGDGDLRRLAHWVGALMVFIGAQFGVVLEGPMGGVVFWSLLGLACSYDAEAADDDKVETAVPMERLPATRRPTPEPALAG